MPTSHIASVQKSQDKTGSALYSLAQISDEDATMVDISVKIPD